MQAHRSSIPSHELVLVANLPVPNFNVENGRLAVIHAQVKLFLPVWVHCLVQHPALVSLAPQLKLAVRADVCTRGVRRGMRRGVG